MHKIHTGTGTVPKSVQMNVNALLRAILQPGSPLSPRQTRAMVTLECSVFGIILYNRGLLVLILISTSQIVKPL